MKVLSGRKMFGFILLTILFSIAIGIYIIITKGQNIGSVLIAWISAEATIYTVAVEAGVVEKKHRMQYNSQETSDDYTGNIK